MKPILKKGLQGVSRMRGKNPISITYKKLLYESADLHN